MTTYFSVSKIRYSNRSSPSVRLSPRHLVESFCQTLYGNGCILCLHLRNIQLQWVSNIYNPVQPLLVCRQLKMLQHSVYEEISASMKGNKFMFDLHLHNVNL